MSNSDLPVFLTGSTGTGRRSLALTIARERAHGRLSDIRVLNGSNEGAVADIRPARGRSLTVVVVDADALGAAEQAQLCDLLHQQGLRWTGTANDPQRLIPELGARISSSAWHLPDLQDRGGDLIEWARYFLAQVAGNSEGRRYRFTPDAEAAIVMAPWPGNLVQLRSTVEQAVVVAERPEVGAADLAIGNADAPSKGDSDEGRFLTLAEATKAFQRSHVQRALDLCRGNRTHAAKLLGVDVRTVHRFLQA